MKVPSLKLINPAYESALTDVVIELEHLRRLQLRGTTPPNIFYQLKDIFLFIESLGSARIEGNRTTVSDYVEARLKEKTNREDRFREIENIEKALQFVEKQEGNDNITHQFISDLHKYVVKDLSKEGDSEPGKYRSTSIAIAGSIHKPPPPVFVRPMMDDLLDFINSKGESKYDLIKTALAHHAFCWIHPFGNGNGRVVRLLTYRLLIKFGFKVKNDQGRLLNPTAVFCNNRTKYYEMLAVADKGDASSLEDWCSYVLGGLKNEIEKLNQLTDYDYLKSRILLPAIKICHERNALSHEEKTILEKILNSGFSVIQSKDFKSAFPSKTPRQRTYMIQKLIERKVVVPINPRARSYSFSFANNKLLSIVIDQLIKHGFAPNID